MVDLEKRHLDEVLAILARHVPDCEVRAFGSRVTGKAREFSDLDLALVCNEKLDWTVIEKLKDAYSESDIPVVVDVLDWNAISEEFRKHIEKGYEVVQRGTKQKPAVA